ncbi:MAG: M28 family peptidase [Candidatus Eisenbacteria bacterium]|nr:M28 family peptidase [Candidatus Latescibacterota bacterium]MBD3302675.1 M28 family peptidase [Candidatus Eisenbacteria bacterium]
MEESMSSLRPVIRSLPALLLVLAVGFGVADAAQTYHWFPSGIETDPIEPGALLVHEGLSGILVVADPEQTIDLRIHGGRPLALGAGETLFVAYVEDGRAAQFSPPARVLLRTEHEVFLAVPEGIDPRLTERSSSQMKGLQQMVRIEAHPVPWSTLDPVPPPAAPREVDPIVQEIVNGLTEANYLATWQTLDDFETRYTYTPENEAATQWILDEFLAMGLDAEFHYYQQSGERRNVVATHPGLVEPEKVVYLVGHLDSISEDPDVCAPGADDNGSGTAAVIETARILSQYFFEYTIKFVGFNGEEQGLYGSAAYVADIAAAGEDVVGCFNMDMIAYRGNDPAPADLIIYTNNNSLPIAQTLETAINDYLSDVLEPVLLIEAIGASDHASFWNYGYQAILAIEEEAWGQDFCPWYHTCEDRIERYPLDYPTWCTQANLAAAATTAKPISPDGTFLALVETVVDDDQTGPSDGNGDGDPNPAETLELWITLRNLGQQDATNCSGSLATGGEGATIVDGAADWPDIPANGEATNLDPFVVTLAGGVVDGERIDFTLTATDDTGSREVPFTIEVVAPTLAYRGHVVDDAAYGNGNGIPEPGEVLLLEVAVGNDGGQDALAIEAILSSGSPYLTVLDEEGANAEIPSGGEGVLAPPFRVAISTDAPDDALIDCDLSFTANQGYAAVGGFSLRVGSFFYDDVEADGAWTLEAVGDDAETGQWVRVDPNGSEYNGQPCQTEDDHTPDPGTDCFVTGQGPVDGGAGAADVDGGRTTLTSPTFDLTGVTGPEITYWRWYTNDLGNNPGQDEWVVQISSDGGTSWTDLERTTASQNSWQERTFLVADYVTPTEEIVVRFIASDEGGGSLVEAAVDDFLITGEGAPVSADDAAGRLALRLDPARPNPVAGRATLAFTLPEDGRATVRLYGVDGRLVQTLVDGVLSAGTHRIDFDGKTRNGAEIAPGIYFATLRAGGEERIRRLVVIE